MTEQTAPRTRNAAETKARILRAAQDAFSQIGYAQAGIREIATMAGVSSTLLIRYYGSKAGLFEAALKDAIRLDDLLSSDRSIFGETLVRLFLDDNIEVRAPAMIALASSDPESREIATRVTEEYGVKPLADWLGPPRAHDRAVGITMLTTGFVSFTRQIPLMPLDKGVNPAMGRWLARTIQALVDGDGGLED